MSRSLKTPQKAKPSAAKSSRSSSPRSARVSPPEPPPQSGVRPSLGEPSPCMSERGAVQLHALIQGAEVVANEAQW